MIIDAPGGLSPAEISILQAASYNNGYNAGYAYYPIENPPVGGLDYQQGYDDGYAQYAIDNPYQDIYDSGYAAGYAQYPVDNTFNEDFCTVVNNSSKDFRIEWADSASLTPNVYSISCAVGSSIKIPYSIVASNQYGILNPNLYMDTPRAYYNFSHHYPSDVSLDNVQVYNVGLDSQPQTYPFTIVLKSIGEILTVTDV